MKQCAHICRICGYCYVPSSPVDRAEHRRIHKALANGGLTQDIRDFAKAFGWAVAHNDGGLTRLSNRYEPEIGKRIVAFSWWSRARSNGAPAKDFDAFMEAHLKLVDAHCSENDRLVELAQTGIKPWEKFAG